MLGHIRVWGAQHQVEIGFDAPKRGAKNGFEAFEVVTRTDSRRLGRGQE